MCMNGSCVMTLNLSLFILYNLGSVGVGKMSYCSNGDEFLFQTIIFSV